MYGDSRDLRHHRLDPFDVNHVAFPVECTNHPYCIALEGLRMLRVVEPVDLS